MSSLGKLTGWLREGKDSSSSFLVGRAVNQAIHSYGRMLNLKIDSRQKTVQCEVLLKGEAEPLTFIVQQYEIITGPEGTFIIIRKAAASREWLTAVLENFLCGRRIPVPEKYAGILRMIA